MANGQTRVGVIGAGPAGLTAAYRLARRGVAVVVFEARAAVGGRTWTDDVDGYRVDGGAQLFGSGYRRFLAVAKDVGLERELVRAPGRDALWRGGRAHEVVYGSVTSMVASGGLSWATKLQLGTKYVPFLTRMKSRLELSAPEKAAEAGLDAEAIATWGEREIGRDFIEYLAYPQLAAYYGSLPEETGAAVYHILAKQGTDLDLYALRRGSGSFCEALAAAVGGAGGEVRTGSPVRSVSEASGGVRVEGDGWEERFDGVVVATPAPEAREVLADGPARVRGWLETVRVRPMLSLALFLDRPTGVGYFGLSFPRGSGVALSALCIQENKGAAVVPPGRGLIVAFAAPKVAERLSEAPAREILEEILPGIRMALPDVDSAIARARVYRWPRAQPIFFPGHLARTAKYRTEEVEGDSRIALAGDYLRFPAIEGAVATGEEAAERIVGRLASV